jgi:proline iminopeptidase
LALEYAIRHPDRVSRLILMNTAPVSHEDWILFLQELSKKPHAKELEALEHTPKYEEGDPETVVYDDRLLFSYTVRQPEQLERLIDNMTHRLTKERILKVRKIARRLWEETLDLDGYNLLPKLNQFRIPTLVIHGDYDFVPITCAARIAQAIPGSHFVVLKETGHFAYIERPDEVRKEIYNFLSNAVKGK